MLDIKYSFFGWRWTKKDIFNFATLWRLVSLKRWSNYIIVKKDLRFRKSGWINGKPGI